MAALYSRNKPKVNKKDIEKSVNIGSTFELVINYANERKNNSLAQKFADKYLCQNVTLQEIFQHYQTTLKGNSHIEPSSKSKVVKKLKEKAPYTDFKNLSMLTEEDYAISIPLHNQFKKKEKEPLKKSNAQNLDGGRSMEHPKVINAQNLDDDTSMECPVCLDFPEAPPVYKCENNHILCNLCQQDILKHSNLCPICGVKLGMDRCFITELHIYAGNLPKKCKYAEFGCLVREIDRSKLSMHEQFCKKAPRDYDITQKRKNEEKFLLLRKDADLALEVKDQEMDTAFASEINDEGLAAAIEKSQNNAVVMLEVEKEDYEFSLRLQTEMQNEISQEIAAREKQEASGLEFAKRLQLELDGNYSDSE